MKLFRKKINNRKEKNMDELKFPQVEFVFKKQVIAKVDKSDIDLLKYHLSEYKDIPEPDIVKLILERDLLHGKIVDDKSIRTMKLHVTSQCFKTIDNWLEFRVHEILKENMLLCKDCLLLDKDDHYCPMYFSKMNPNNIACDNFIKDDTKPADVRAETIKNLEKIEASTVRFH